VEGKPGAFGATAKVSMADYFKQKMAAAGLAPAAGVRRSPRLGGVEPGAGLGMGGGSDLGRPDEETGGAFGLRELDGSVKATFRETGPKKVSP
jgi:hypothetical protein